MHTIKTILAAITILVCMSYKEPLKLDQPQWISNKMQNTKQTNGFVSLPFDSKAYYEACIYPGTKDCSSKYPSHQFSNDAFLKQVTSTYQKEPTQYFKIPNKDVEVYLVHFQGDDADEYSLLTMINNKIIATLIVGISGDTIIDFVIDKQQVSLFKRNNSRQPFEKYSISSKGKFIKI